MKWRILTERSAVIGMVASFVVGAVFGLTVLGWLVWPVEYVNTDPYSLRERHQETYVQMVADSYQLTGDLQQAQSRLYELEGKARSAADVAAFVAELAAKRKAAGAADEAARLQALAAAIQAPLAVAPSPTPEQPVEAAGLKVKGLLRICLVLLFVLLVVAGLLLIWSYLRGRRARPRMPKRMPAPRRPRPVEQEEEVAVAEEEAPAREWKPAEIPWDVSEAQLALGHFVTTFELGDDGYDESFGIETDAGEFLGECGVAISELITSGTPEKPTAFDIWLFDKSDIRTVTTVVASPYAYQDEALRAKLGAKGDVVLAKEGDTITLETASLRVRAEIVSVAYGGGELPPESYFTKFTVELSPSRKPTE